MVIAGSREAGEQASPINIEKAKSLHNKGFSMSLSLNLHISLCHPCVAGVPMENFLVTLCVQLLF